MRKTAIGLILCLIACTSFGQANRIAIAEIEGDGYKLIVDDQDFIINGMNWDYIPIGSNYNYSLWSQPDVFIETALKTEMSLLKDMGVNVIRQYTGVPSKWITYIYDHYGIYTMLNHAFGRYGVALDDTWQEQTNYSTLEVRSQLLTEVSTLAAEYKDTRGLLMYLLGNENNYGLFWEGAETGDMPEVNQQTSEHARAMYTLFNEAAIEIKRIDSNHPVAMCNGDLLFLDLIAETCKDVDIFGTNIYRGLSFGDAFVHVKEKLNMPLMFTEFGADAFHAFKDKEDQLAQAQYLVANWKEIYENVAGLDKTQISIGGFTFQFSDGWWKHGQTINLSQHDNNASWKNAGYHHDFVKDQNNMNEEWFGVCAKGLPDEQGLYELTPRLAYYVLKEVHHLDLFDANTNQETINQHFSKINLESLTGSSAALKVKLK